MCNIWVRSDGRVERKRGHRHTDSWHEWVQNNFYGRSATKRIVIKEPSLNLIKLVVDAIDVQKDVPKLFEGLGKVNMQHHINLTEDARPVGPMLVCSTQSTSPLTTKSRIIMI